ncbi:MAG: hypothetical protein WDO73_09195 [Ignavibacteriota bacterium]
MRITMTICAVAMAFCGMSQAQQATSVDQVKVHFSTPVDAGGATIAAGDCSIQVLRAANNLMLELHPETGPTVLVMATRFNEPFSRTEAGGAAQVILSRRGDNYRFDRILMPDHSGFELQGSIE